MIVDLIQSVTVMMLAAAMYVISKQVDWLFDQLATLHARYIVNESEKLCQGPEKFSDK